MNGEPACGSKSADGCADTRVQKHETSSLVESSTGCAPQQPQQSSMDCIDQSNPMEEHEDPSDVQDSESANDSVPSHYGHVSMKKRLAAMPPEEQKAMWRLQRRQRKERKRDSLADERERHQKEWENLDEEEKEKRRQSAIAVHEARRRAEAAQDEEARLSLASDATPTLVFDLSFSYCMTPSDCRSTLSQLKLSYSILRRAAFPFKPLFTSLTGIDESDEIAGGKASESHMKEIGNVLSTLESYNGFSKFPPQMHPLHWSTLVDKEKVVFLTADTDATLTTIEPGTAYIIGAFVDHNRQKGLSKAAADRYGVRCARLPLVESLVVGNICKVLTINHCTEVLCRFMKSHDWKDAFAALPTRRQGTESKRARRKHGTAETSECDGPAADGSEKNCGEDSEEGSKPS